MEDMKRGDIITIQGEVEGVVKESDATLLKVKVDDRPHGIWIDARFVKTWRPVNEAENERY